MRVFLEDDVRGWGWNWAAVERRSAEAVLDHFLLVERAGLSLCGPCRVFSRSKLSHTRTKTSWGCQQLMVGIRDSFFTLNEVIFANFRPRLLTLGQATSSDDPPFHLDALSCLIWSKLRTLSKPAPAKLSPRFQRFVSAKTVFLLDSRMFAESFSLPRGIIFRLMWFRCRRGEWRMP